MLYRVLHVGVFTNQVVTSCNWNIYVRDLTLTTEKGFGGDVDSESVFGLPPPEVLTDADGKRERG